MADAPRRIPPPGVLLFMGYAFLVLAVIGISMRWVIDQAISAPISPLGFVVMALLAYTIFTTTMVIQRKEAARGLAIALSTLMIVPAIYCVLFWVPWFGIPPALLFVLLLVGLRRPASRLYFSEP
jgi:hypothetical protein